MSTEEKVGQATGGVAGAVAGASLGSVAGPVGTVLGGIAGAVGGWWAGEKVGRAIDDWTEEDEQAVRALYEGRDEPDIDYDAALTGYVIGYVAADNPEYDDYLGVDGALRDHWSWDEYDYERVRPYMRAGFHRRRARDD